MRASLPPAHHSFPPPLPDLPPRPLVPRLEQRRPTRQDCTRPRHGRLVAVPRSGQSTRFLSHGSTRRSPLGGAAGALPLPRAASRLTLIHSIAVQSGPGPRVRGSNRNARAQALGQIRHFRSVRGASSVPLACSALPQPQLSRITISMSLTDSYSSPPQTTSTWSRTPRST
jgi:hypothetical protein